MSEPMLTIHNRHPATSGIPPAFSTEAADLYIGYFENRHGEQWIFALLGRVDGLILAPEEGEWLQACWSATRA